MRALPVLIVLALLACGPGDSGPPPVDLEARPDGLARQYLAMVREGRVEEAWSLLAPALQEEEGKALFARTYREYLGTPRGKQVYEKAQVIRETVSGKSAVVNVSAGPEETWTWEFAQTGQGWRITRLQAPPFQLPSAALPGASTPAGSSPPAAGASP